jgi:hypothetical protein
MKTDKLIFLISMIGYAIAFGGLFIITTHPYIAIIGMGIALSYPTYYFHSTTN